MSEPFRVLVADPPWSFTDQCPGNGRGARKHYRCMTVTEIRQFELPPLADSAVLFLWRVAAMQQDAYAVLRAWGFALKSEIVWVKMKGGKPQMGMGHTVRNAHETCLIATRGKVSDVVQSHSIPSVLFAERTRHSAKPEAFYDMVEKLCLGPYVELFARRRRPGWTCFGNELPELKAAE